MFSSTLAASYTSPCSRFLTLFGVRLPLNRRPNSLPTVALLKQQVSHRLVSHLSEIKLFRKHKLKVIDVAAQSKGLLRHLLNRPWHLHSEFSCKNHPMTFSEGFPYEHCQKKRFSLSLTHTQQQQSSLKLMENACIMK